MATNTNFFGGRELNEEGRGVTAVLLSEALERSRMEQEGITLELTARIIKKNLKPEEVEILIEHLGV